MINLPYLLGILLCLIGAIIMVLPDNGMGVGIVIVIIGITVFSSKRKSN